ncbi:MAG: hypothetical protein OQL08_08765, partial [Gammaproteobacteria bacterium]|nr:hypothetical protein [Gammaproteobacteria bacterium]
MRRLLRLFLILLLGVTAVGYGLLGTEAGNRALLAWSLGDRLQVDSLRGALLQGRLEINGLRYRDQDQQLDVRRLLLTWGPGALLHGELQIRDLEL